MPNEQLTLDPVRVICGRHGEVFKHRWPVGYPEFSTIALECLLTQTKFEGEMAGAINDPAWPSVKTPPTAIAHLLAKKPICCRLPPDDLLAVYEEVDLKANVWEARRCDLCGHTRRGTTYRRARPTAAHPHDPAHSLPPWRHVCLPCVCHGQNGSS